MKTRSLEEKRRNDKMFVRQRRRRIDKTASLNDLKINYFAWVTWRYVAVLQ